MKTKEQLEQEIKELNELVNQAAITKDNITSQIHAAQQELAEVNMPIITESVRNIIRDAVNQAVCGFNFDPDDFEYDFSLGYTNRIEIDSLEFQHRDNLEEQICDYIESNFKIIEDAE